MLEEYIKKLESINKDMKNRIVRLQSQLEIYKAKRLKNSKPGIPIRQATGVINNRRGVKL